MNRVAIVGKTGSGKTTLARQLSAKLGLEQIELDSIAWGPNWRMSPPDEFRAKVEVRTRVLRWVTDGNYREVRPYVWGRADTLIWLDYPLPLVLWRITVRTIRRAAKHELLWGNNVERLQGLFGRDSLLLYAIKTHRTHRLEFPELLEKPDYKHLSVLKFNTPAEAANWLKEETCKAVEAPQVSLEK